MKTTILIFAALAASLLTGCDTYVEHGRYPSRSYGYYGHRHYYDDGPRYYGYRRYSYSRPSYYYSERPTYYGRSYYSRPSTTVVVGRSGPYVHGRVVRHY